MSATNLTPFLADLAMILYADELRLTQSVWGGGLTAAQVVSTYASNTGSGVLLDVGGGQSILLQGLASSLGLKADILLV
jgi:hypothetical protein